MKHLLLSLALLSTPVFAETPTHPVKVSAAEAADGAIFTNPKAVKHVGKKGNATQWYEMMSSTDGKMSAGTYSSTEVRNEIASYPDNEFMYFIKGGVTLTSSDGTVLVANTGDGVAMPKGWKGVWDTKGYTKFYVTYDPAAAPK